MQDSLSSRDYIIEAFFLLLRDNVIDDISVASICDKAGVSRVTFYRNFKDKNEIIDGYFTKMIRQFVIEMGTRHSNTNYYDIAYQSFYFLREEKENIKALTKSNLSYLYLNILNEKLSNNFNAEGYGNEMTAYVYAGGLYNLSMWWVIKDDCRTGIEDMIKAFFSICNFEKAQ